MSLSRCRKSAWVIRASGRTLSLEANEQARLLIFNQESSASLGKMVEDIQPIHSELCCDDARTRPTTHLVLQKLLFLYVNPLSRLASAPSLLRASSSFSSSEDMSRKLRLAPGIVRPLRYRFDSQPDEASTAETVFSDCEKSLARVLTCCVSTDVLLDLDGTSSIISGFTTCLILIVFSATFSFSACVLGHCISKANRTRPSS